MNNLLSKKQVVVFLLICMLSTKIQRLPSYISYFAKQDGWLVFLLFMLMDMVFVMLACNIVKWCQDTSLYEALKESLGTVIAKGIMLLLTIFFFFKCNLSFKASHEFFGNVLFDRLSWEFFSLLLSLVVIFMVQKGLSTIARTNEIFYRFIMLGFIGALALGAFTTKFENILPFFYQNASFLSTSVIETALWFSEYLLLIAMAGKIKKEDRNLKKPLVLLTLCMGLLFSFMYVVFYSLYQNVAGLQIHALSSITQFSLLGLDIGRIDWFLVLLSTFSTVLAAACYMYFAVDCMRNCLGLQASKYGFLVTYILVLGVWALDIFVFNKIENFFIMVSTWLKYIVLFTVYVVPILICVAIYYNVRKQRRKI